MIEKRIGPDAFQKGIRLYLAKHARGNATYADLIAALEEASGQPVRPIADDFVDRTGVPFVDFTLVCEKTAGAKPRLEMAQHRFVPFASTLDKNRTWHVPIVVRWQAGKTSGRASTVLDAATGRLELADAPACPDWVMPNADGIGYYRWSLAGAPFERLRSPAVFKALPATERLEVAASIGALVSTGDLPFRRNIELAVTLVDDPTRQVRRIGLSAGAGWDEWLPKDVVPRYRTWVAKTYGPLARKVGFAPSKAGDETDDERAIRTQVLSRMVDDAEDAATIREATALCWKWLDDRTAVAPEMVGTVLDIAAHGGNTKLYERILAEARKADAAHDKNERERFLDALGSFRDPALVERTRAMALGDEFPVLETEGLLWAGTDTRAGRDRAWAFLTANYDTILARLPNETRASLLSIGGDCTAEGLERTKAFFAERTPKVLQGPRTYKRFVESQTLCIATREKDTASFVELLNGK
jgi:alanyl aminopeptidase